MALEEIINDFLQQVDSIVGLYLDAQQGFRRNLEQLAKAQQHTSDQFGLSIEQLDDTALIYGEGNPNMPDAKVIHVTKQGDFRLRNSPDGINIRILGNLCLAQIYQLWEDNYRGSIAEAMGRERKEIRSDLFGDIRNYRNSIIHEKAIASSNVSKNKILAWFSPGDQIFVKDSHLKQLKEAIDQEIQSQYLK